MRSLSEPLKVKWMFSSFIGAWFNFLFALRGYTWVRTLCVYILYKKKETNALFRSSRSKSSTFAINKIFLKTFKKFMFIFPFENIDSLSKGRWPTHKWAFVVLTRVACKSGLPPDCSRLQTFVPSFVNLPADGPKLIEQNFSAQHQSDSLLQVLGVFPPAPFLKEFNCYNLY